MHAPFPRVLLDPASAAGYPTLRVPIREVWSFTARTCTNYLLVAEDGAVFSVKHDVYTPWNGRMRVDDYLPLPGPVVWAGAGGLLVTSTGVALHYSLGKEESDCMLHGLPFPEPVRQVGKALVHHNTVYYGLTARGTLIASNNRKVPAPAFAQPARELHSDSWCCFARLADGSWHRVPSYNTPWRAPVPYPIGELWFVVSLLDLPGNDKCLPAPDERATAWSQLYLAHRVRTVAGTEVEPGAEGAGNPDDREPGAPEFDERAVVYYTEYRRMDGEVTERLQVRCVMTLPAA